MCLSHVIVQARQRSHLCVSSSLLSQFNLSKLSSQLIKSQVNYQKNTELSLKSLFTLLPSKPIIIMSNRALQVGGVVAVGGIGYYLYTAGGNPKVAEKQFEGMLII